MPVGSDAAAHAHGRPAPERGTVTTTAPRGTGAVTPGGGDGGPAPRRATIAARSLRTDRWWLLPLTTVVVLLSFVVYSTFRAFQNAYYFSEPYISPFYSPCITTGCEGDTFPELFTGPSFISPALYILVIPLGLRATCYYYRKAYYRSFWLSPPACAVAEPHRRYTGESRPPLVLAEPAPLRPLRRAGLQRDPHLRRDPGVPRRDRRVGPHGPRHARAAGQRRPAVACTRCPATPAGTSSAAGSTTSPGIRCATGSGRRSRGSTPRHARYAWLSLFSVAIADAYVFLLATGTISDPRFF